MNNPLSTAIQATDTSLTLFSLLLLLLLFLFFIAAVIAKVDSQQTSEDGRLLFTVMEYVPSGDVSHHIQQRGTLSEDEARKLFNGLLRGLEHCHDRGVAHRDLKVPLLHSTSMSTVPQHPH